MIGICPECGEPVAEWVVPAPEGMAERQRLAHPLAAVGGCGHWTTRRRIVLAAQMAGDGSGVSEYATTGDRGARVATGAARGVVVGVVEFREPPEWDGDE